jgi:hypothetical protein
MLNSFIWWVILLLGVVATVRGWRWRPWVFVAVAFVFRVAVEAQIDQTSSRLVDWTLSLDNESMTTGFTAASAVLSSEMNKFYSVLLIAQLCVLAVLVVMSFNTFARWAEARAGLKPAAAQDAQATTHFYSAGKQGERPLEDQLYRLDGLLKNQLITVEEFQERRAHILVEQKEHAAQLEKERVQRLTAPYAARLRAVQYFASQRLLTAEQVRERTDTVLTELL